MEEAEQCSMSNCPNTPQNCDEAFYQFPPDFEMCMSWVTNSGNARFLEDFSYLGPCLFLKKKMCTAHFSGDDFVVYSDRYSGLKPNAVPQPYYMTGEVVYEDDIQLESTLTEVTSDNIIIKQEMRQDHQNSFLTVLRAEPLLVVSQDMLSRRQKNALRTAVKRQSETPEQRAERRIKDLIRSSKRRQAETKLQRQIRRYNDAVRAAYRRSNETDEQRARRRLVDIARATRRRQNETADQRLARLKADRERAARRRYLKKVAETGNNTSVKVLSMRGAKKLISHFRNVSDKLMEITKEAVEDSADNVAENVVQL